MQEGYVPERLPALGAQEAYWHLNRFAPGALSSTISIGVTLAGPLDRDALAWALDEVARCQPALRTTFEETVGGPVQAIHSELHLPLRHVRCTGTAAERRVQATQAEREDRAAPFDLATGPLMRATLIECARDEHVLVLVAQHAAVDAPGLDLVVEQLLACYEARLAGRSSPLHNLTDAYRAEVLAQSESLDDDTLRRCTEYWRRCATAARPLIEIPDAAFDGQSRHHEAGCLALRSDLDAFARLHETTPFAVAAATLRTLLASYTGASSFFIMTPSTRRGTAASQRLAGMFTGLLLLLARTDPDATFAELLGREHATLREALAHDKLQLELLPALAPEFDDSWWSDLRRHIYEVMSVGLWYRDVRRTAPAPSGLRVDLTMQGSAESPFFYMLAYRKDDGLHLALDHSTVFFDERRAARLCDDFVTLLNAAMERPHVPVRELAPQLAGAPPWRDLARDAGEGRPATADR